MRSCTTRRWVCVWDWLEQVLSVVYRFEKECSERFLCALAYVCRATACPASISICCICTWLAPSPPPHSLSTLQTTQHAQSQAYGYVIPQDSDYNNFILPVLPRFNAQGELKQPHITSKWWKRELAKSSHSAPSIDGVHMTSSLLILWVAGISLQLVLQAV